MLAHLLFSTVLSLTPHPIKPVPHHILHRKVVAQVEDKAYQRRLIIQLCEIKPWFCDWLISS